MNPVDRGAREVPPCGYGLLGLCCFDCLRGPCRISPFDKGQALCEAEADWLVAGNLCRLTAEEFLLALRSFTRAVHQYKKRKESAGTFSKHSIEVLALKYGMPREGLIPFLEEEMINLLNPLADPPARLFSSLFPEGPFPPGNSNRPWVSLWSELFGLARWKEHEGDDPEALLWQCLNCAAGMLMIEEFAQDILSLSGSDEERGGGEVPTDFSPNPQPLVVSLFEAEYPVSLEMQTLSKAIKEISGVVSIPIRGIQDLILVCRAIQEKWNRRLSDLPVAVLVESANIATILAPLALGIPTVSHPSLPIHGSQKVEDFFYSGLPQKMGNFYLPAKDETALSRLSGILVAK